MHRSIACGIRALKLVYLFTLSLVKAVHTIELPCSVIEHTKNSKEQVEHCLISARKIA